MKRFIICAMAIGFISPATTNRAAASGINPGNWNLPFSFGINDGDNHLPSDVNTYNTKPKKKKSHWATPNQMRQNGYRQYGDVRMDNYRNVYIGGKRVGKGKVKKSKRGRYYVDYRTKDGGRIIKQGNGQIWRKPGLKYDNVVTRKRNSGGKYLGNFNINAYRQRRFGR